MRPTMALALLALWLPPAGAAVLHVAPNGRAGAPGTAGQPLASIQDGLDRARAGDTVRVHPGVYRERVEFPRGGERGKPVTLEGDPGAVLDGSEAFTPEWQPAADVAPGAWRTRVPFVPFTITADGKIVTLLREDRVDPAKVSDPKWQWPTLFKSGVGPSGWEGVKALALYLGGPRELLIRFQGDRDPRTIPFTFAPREACVHISGANRCVVRGLSLRSAAYGVLIEDSLGSVVENCTIGPVDYGVWLGSGSDRCTLRFNEILMNPYAGADPDLKGAWDNWQAHKTGGHYDRYGVQIRNTAGGHEIHDNNVHDTWDGIEDVGKPGENRGLRIHHNRIYNVSDDGLEPNGAEEDCRWYENVVERSICGFRIKSPTVGPLYAYRNIFFANHEDYRNFGEVEPKPARVYVYHNTCTANAAIQSNKVRGIGTPNYHYYNNLFWCAGWWGNTGPSVEPNWKGDHNVHVRRGTERRWDQGRQLAARLGLDAHSLWVEGDPGFADVDARDVSLKPESPARGRGADLSKLLGKPLPGCEPGYFTGAAPDAGALPFGAPMPRLPRRPAEVKAPVAGTWPEADARPAADPGGPNLLANGGFERGLDGWPLPDAAGFQLRRGDAAEGERYLSIQGRADLPSAKRVLGGLKPGSTYVVTFRSRRSTLSDMRIILRNPANNAYLHNASASAGRAWRRTSLRFTAPGAEVSLEISPRSEGVCDLDAFTLTKAR